MNRKSFRKWTNEELVYLKENFGKIYAKDIAAHLNTTTNRVIHKAYELKLKSNLTKFTTAEGKLKFFKCKLIDKYTNINDKLLFKCGYCGKEFRTTPNKILRKHTKSCGCLKNKSKEFSGYVNRRKGGKYISSTYFTIVKRGASVRNLEFTLTIEDVDKLIEQQNFKCALSGRLLTYGYIDISKQTASLDRIDSLKGYTPDNVQWVDKQVNMCKQQYSQEDFVRMCNEVSKYQSSRCYKQT